MTTRRLRHLLTLLAASLTLAAIGVVVGAVLGRPASGPSISRQDLDPAGGSSVDNPAIPAPPDRGELLALAEQPLRQQLFDPPPPPPEQEPPPPPLPGIELISTLLPSQGAPSAWVRDHAHGNAPRKVRVGDTLGPTGNTATVLAIEPSRLLVEHHGETKPIERAAPQSGGRR